MDPERIDRPPRFPLHQRRHLDPRMDPTRPLHLHSLVCINAAIDDRGRARSPPLRWTNDVTACHPRRPPPVSSCSHRRQLSQNLRSNRRGLRPSETGLVFSMLLPLIRQSATRQTTATDHRQTEEGASLDFFTFRRAPQNLPPQVHNHAYAGRTPSTSSARQANNGRRRALDDHPPEPR